MKKVLIPLIIIILSGLGLWYVNRGRLPVLPIEILDERGEIILGGTEPLPADTTDYFLYIRTYDRPEMKPGEGGRSKKGDIVQILKCADYPNPSPTEKKEWLIIKVSNLTDTQRELMMKSWQQPTMFNENGTEVISYKTLAYRMYKLDLDSLKSLTNIKIETGLFDVKIPTTTVVPKLSAKTSADLTRYKTQAYEYALITKPALKLARVIVPYAWATTTNTKTVIPAGGGDYATLSAWEDARDGNLVTSDFIEIANCSGATADTTVVVIAGWTTDTTHYIEINGDYAVTSGVHYSTSYYRIEPASGVALTLPTSYSTCDIKISKLQITTVNSVAISCATRGTGNLYIYNNIIKESSGGTTYQGGISMSGFGGSTSLITYIYNNIIYDFTTDRQYGMSLGNDGYGTFYVYNNTVQNCYRQIGFGGSSITIKNNLCQSKSNVDGVDYMGTFTTTSNNISEDTTSPDVDYRSKTIIFVSESTDDFHLAFNDTNAIDKGVDLSATFTTDIDGVTRTGTWDIGADEYVAVGGVTWWGGNIGSGIGVGIGGGR